MVNFHWTKRGPYKRARVQSCGYSTICYGISRYDIVQQGISKSFDLLGRCLLLILSALYSTHSGGKSFLERRTGLTLHMRLCSLACSHAGCSSQFEVGPSPTAIHSPPASFRSPPPHRNALTCSFAPFSPLPCIASFLPFSLYVVVVLLPLPASRIVRTPCIQV